MEIKGVNIVAPDGYEIDEDNSTLERIIFKKKVDDRPRTWEEFCKRGLTGEEGYISIIGAVKSCSTKGAYRNTTAVGYTNTLEEAEAFVALMQLRQLRKSWTEDWEPEWSTSCAYDDRYGLINSYDVIIVEQTENNNPLSFPTEEMAKEFLKCFKDLLEKAKILL